MSARTAHPAALAMLEQTKVASRLFEKLQVTDGCWEWTGARNARGYGVFHLTRGHQISAHRAVWIVIRGPLRDDLQLDHLCRNRACVNPDHLDPVSARENILRGLSPAAWHVFVRACPRGHPYNEENTYVAQNGGRSCKICRRLAMRRLRARRRASSVERVRHEPAQAARAEPASP